MGYKLAGYDVVAANDIDPRMAQVYEKNHHPKQFFLCSVKELIDRDDLPDIDVLDGSPPCSVFSTAGKRDKGWQVDKMFKEGQAKQVLDDLFFDFIDLAEKMQPKVIVAENVKGMLAGDAKWYTREVVRRLDGIGYRCQVFLLNSATMGVPQRRQRVFFLARREDQWPADGLDMDFDELPITLGDIHQDELGRPIEAKGLPIWRATRPGKSFSSVTGASWFSHKKLHFNQVPLTMTAACTQNLALPHSPHYISEGTALRGSSFPSDFDFLDSSPGYICGMSVPPVMMARVAHQVYCQLLSGTQDKIVSGIKQE